MTELENMEEFVEFVNNGKKDGFCDCMLGGASSWDLPVWSGKWMFGFFMSKKISEDKITQEMINAFHDYIEYSLEEAIPSYVFDDPDGMNPDYLDLDSARAARDSILETLVDGQLDCSDSALEDVKMLRIGGAIETEQEKWHSYFSSLFLFSAWASFESVNGYELGFPEEITEGNKDAPVNPKLVKKKKGKSGYVYLVRQVGGEHFKIGRSVDVTKRLRTFNVKLPFKVELDHSFKCDNYLDGEKFMHKKFANKRVDGEWFNLSGDEVEAIKSISEFSNGELLFN